MHAHTHARAHALTRTHTHAHTHAHVHARTTHAYAHARLHARTRTHAHTRTRPRAHAGLPANPPRFSPRGQHTCSLTFPRASQRAPQVSARPEDSLPQEKHTILNPVKRCPRRDPPEDADRPRGQAPGARRPCEAGSRVPPRPPPAAPPEGLCEAATPGRHPRCSGGPQCPPRQPSAPNQCGGHTARRGFTERPGVGGTARPRPGTRHPSTDPGALPRGRQAAGAERTC